MALEIVCVPRDLESSYLSDSKTTIRNVLLSSLLTPRDDTKRERHVLSRRRRPHRCVRHIQAGHCVAPHVIVDSKLAHSASVCQTRCNKEATRHGGTGAMSRRHMRRWKRKEGRRAETKRNREGGAEEGMPPVPDERKNPSPCPEAGAPLLPTWPGRDDVAAMASYEHEDGEGWDGARGASGRRGLAAGAERGLAGRGLRGSQEMKEEGEESEEREERGGAVKSGAGRQGDDGSAWCSWAAVGTGG